ncbi:MAG: ABC transporter permease [Chryseolinea sp.]
MIKNYVVLFLRNLRRQKLFSSINLLGLTVSMASAIIIYLYVSNEFNYDSFHSNSERLYRVNQTFIWSEDGDQFSRTGPGVAHAMKQELPEVELVTSFHTPGDFIISYVKPSGDVVAFEENKVLAADSNFFKVFNFPLVAGDEGSAFRQANSLVMTKSTAEKYFGNENPVGKLVRLGGLNGNEGQTYEVTGVMNNVPGNSTVDFDLLLSMKSFPQVEKRYWSWVWTQLETFVLLRADANINNVNEKLRSIPRKRAEESIKAAMGVTYDEYINKSGKKWELFLQPISTLHLPAEQVSGSFPDVGNRKTIFSFIAAAVFIVLLSCINFMNLSTAQFTRRIKEASIRKILGLGKRELSLSYFIEALTFCFVALIVALASTQLLLPGFNLLTGKHLTFSLFSDPILTVGVIALPIFMALMSSSYPALFLTAFNPINAIKGKSKAGRAGKSFRNGLVVFQFSVSIVLMICTAIVFQQLKYVSEKDLGFDKNNLVVLHHAESVKNGESLVNAMLNVPGTASASWCTSAPPTVFGGDTFTKEGSTDIKFPLNFTLADENYIPTLGIKLRYGRNFEAGNPGDSSRVVLNESAVIRIGWTLDESAIGKKIAYPNSGSDLTTFEVIGVIADFNYWSILNSIEPMAIFSSKNKYVSDGNKTYLVVKIKPQTAEAWQKTFAGMKSTWKQFAGDTPFEYTFMDENFAKTFATQQQFGKILTVMAALAILIASLGLLGMIIYSLEQRTKEIGIRKVSGASVYNILILLSTGYTRLILIAFIIGAPIAYYMMQYWLIDFAYPITPSLWIFTFAGGSTLLLAIAITGYHSVKAALTNPVDVLRDE